MAAFLIVTAVIGGVTSGINDAVNGNKIRKGICATNKQINTVTKAYNALLSAQEQDIQTLQTEFEQGIEQLAAEKATLKTLRENYAKSRNQMIIASILFVVSIIISFMFKEFGFFDLVYNAIFGTGKTASIKSA
jgi:hypothetical protein